ncbi:ABC transporter permease subunit [Glycomyces tenuis]|uniref:ABC transporter permease subunit n=1 Tax=Glycomyces tenuis TaxID=58116 RepID=UPI0004042B24|nr:ABC transporter permease subunit [Glycomyces tenuis]
MTTTMLAETPATYSPPKQFRLSGLGLLRSEWTKFWSLRSSWIVMVCAAAFGAGIGIALAFDYAADADTGGEAAEAQMGLSALDVMFGFGMSAVFIAVLGVLFISGEYTTGSIRSTMSAAPKRTGVLWAKTAVFGTIVLAVYAALLLATFFVTQLIMADTPAGGVGLGDTGVFRVLSGYVVTTVYLGLLGLALGAILRNSAGSISFYIGAIMVLPMLMVQLPWQWVRDIAPYTPGNVPNTLTMPDTAGAQLSLGQSWAWMGVWMVVSFGLAAVLLKRRDV